MIHSNTWKAPVISLKSNSYFVILNDDYSWKVWVYMLKNKSAIFEKFKYFKAWIEHNKNLKIKYLYSDNGREFCSKKFEALCNEHGIK